MSYNMELLVLKKEKFDEEINLHKSFTMEYSYIDFAESCSYLFENAKDDGAMDNGSESEEYGRFIINGNGNGYKIFREFFQNVENESWAIVYKEQYIRLDEWLENRMKQLSLFDVHDPEIAWEYLYSYNQVKRELENIDFDHEFIVFWHSY